MADGDVTAGSLDHQRLGIYLNDHLAGSSAGLDLARRSYASNRGTDHGHVLERLAREIAEDRSALRDIMRRLGVPERCYKVAAARMTERIGRLKPNGQLAGYSPLSRLVELDALLMGIEGKESLWRSLRVVADATPALASVDLDRLVARAEAQHELLGSRRRAVTDEALRAGDGRAHP